ncbi:hypothetical protein SORBI_3002G382001 [Sorghum bicolor]|uniref:Uncharacterized protein n=1 Tax=Sorghum bicolor TaxID=4558 RepID=A0A1W0W7C9_SORBI|nr:hypothetical protein SORBI_3002G382001 [Sorghum bicolor]
MSLHEGSPGRPSDDIADEKEMEEGNGDEGKSCANYSTRTRRLPEVVGAVELPSVGGATWDGGCWDDESKRGQSCEEDEAEQSWVHQHHEDQHWTEVLLYVPWYLKVDSFAFLLRRAPC